ncbi:A/G-specific adenine glycosylase [methane-oxidizing endosymbiont of Gigantopelta aegis]|uniref:A/G-specific adenine glycosylase n=1 Tax=methane-oxidizing endosymbiont of Gigantopelta aegis TaxID=2794938 RepID=UPI0018DBC71F|nr:A/G-specific adenine glycosylase [methane-oxidizing endosymbiont of Gigantopelta aegis]
MDNKTFHRQIFDWFDRHGRKDLPWQHPISAYRVWISEIMLQQTQVATVIPYYQKFMHAFPDIKTLAQASLDDVLTHWAGLGYYARARNLHKAARVIQHQYNGVFPQAFEHVVALPGIGRSTAGAILSIAFGQPHAILDGNVKRVLSRFYGIYGWPGDSKVSKELWQISERLTPQQRTADYTQAMMDMGATVCTRRKPVCSVCPLQPDCYAFHHQETEKLPSTRPRKALPVKQSVFLCLKNNQNQILLQQRPPVGIWGGLWSLPEFDDFSSLEYWCQLHCNDFSIIEQLPDKRHTFSHYHLDYSTVIVKEKNPKNFVMEQDNAVWYKNDAIHSLGLPAPIKRILQEHTEENQWRE